MSHDSFLPEDPGQIDLLVRKEKLKLLFHQSFPALFISLAVALLFSWVIWGQANDAVLFGWLLLLCLATLGRLALFLAYFRAEPTEQNVLRWEQPYVVTLLFSSLLWGCGALLAIPASSPPHQAFAMFTLIGMAGGAISNYSALRFVAVGAMLAVLLPSTLWLIFHPGKLQLAMALGSCIFMLGALRSTKVLSSALHRSLQLTHELRQAHEIAERLARTDALTGVSNRRAFFERGQQIARYCERNTHPLSALLVDIDHFKDINDQYGHSAGDSALQQVGTILQQSFRKSDVCGRLGGEEFAILLPDTPLAEAHEVAEKLRHTVAAMPIVLSDQRATLNVSIGVATGSYDIEALLQHADAAMYRAKRAGRNRVVCHIPADAADMAVVPSTA